MSQPRSFHASWFSSFGAVALVCAVLAAVFVAMLSDPKVPRVAAVFGLSLFGGGLLLAVGLVTGRGPVLQVGPRGVAGHGLRGHTVAWAEIDDLEPRVLHGNHQLVLTLAEGSPSLARTQRLFNARSRQRVVQLGALRAGERRRAIEAALEAFHARGGPSPAVLQQQADDWLMELQFEVDMDRFTPVPVALYLLLGLNVAVWVAQVAGGMSATSASADALLRWGGNSAAEVVGAGQGWRLITAAFLHGSIWHLALNLAGLWGAGTVLNRLQGNGQFVAIYLGSALLGNALSLHFAARHGVSMGASGAVFGVLGAFAVGLMRHRHRLPAGRAAEFVAMQSVFVIGAIVQGVSRGDIDNAAHVGGFVGGAVLGWLLVAPVDASATPARRWRGRALAAAFIALSVTALVAGA